MKKVFCLAFFVLILSLCGCEYSYSNENSEPQGTDNNGTEPQGTDAAESAGTDPVSASDVEIVGEYSLASEDYLAYSKDDTLYILVVKNNSKKTVCIDSFATAYDKKGEEIGVADASLENLPSGCESVIPHFFKSTKNVKKFKYDLDVNEETVFQPAIQNVKVTTKQLDKKVIVTCKNTGEDDIENLFVNVLFFKGKKIVDWSTGFFENSKSLLVSGKEMSKQFVPNNDFDDVKVYLKGWVHEG